MTVLGLCMAAVLLSVMAFALREFGYKGAPLFALLCVVCLLSSAAAPLRQLIPLFDGVLTEESTTQTASAALRIVGVGYVCMLASDICRDLGEAGIARVVVLVSRVCILIIAYPFIQQLISLGYGLIA